ncbi:MAG: inorganic diphosphatase [Pseudomonadota bacterium]
MYFDSVGPGTNVPEDINVVVEIPQNGDPVKYEVDKETGAIFVDRFLGTPMRYPCNYGYIPQTLSGDQDPADVLVVSPLPLIPGSVVRSRPVGILQMEDDGGDDAKILAVPIDKLTRRYRNVRSFRDLPEEHIDRIAHFFQHYKDLEPGKWVKVIGWGGVDAARNEILESVKRYEDQ